MSISVSKERNLTDSILQFLQNFIRLSIVPASQREIVFRVFSLTKDLGKFKYNNQDRYYLLDIALFKKRCIAANTKFHRPL